MSKDWWLMTSLIKSSNPCVCQTTEAILPPSAKIEKRLCQSTSFRGLTYESSKLPLYPKKWHGSYFYLEILGCQFWSHSIMDHLSVLRSLIMTYFNVKKFLKIFSIEKSFITIPKVVLGLQKKSVQQRISCMEG